MAASDIVAHRYASAFFELAEADNVIDARRKDLAAAVERLGDERVAAVFANPKVPTAAKVALGDSVLERLDATVRNLARLLVERGRIGVLPKVLEEYDRLADRAGGRIHAEVVSAVPLDREQERRVRAELAKRLGGDVQVIVKQDPAIIGGLVIRIGDRVIDGSVSTRLRELQAALA